MKRGTPYEVRDTDGRPVSKEEAKAIIAERWTVPEEVRRRRRGRKPRGKVPQQVLPGHANAGARRAATRRPSPPPMLAGQLTPIKDVLRGIASRTGVQP